MDMNDMSVSCIYFVETKITSTPTQLWGVREELRFTQL
jgi:hypothetical protein